MALMTQGGFVHMLKWYAGIAGVKVPPLPGTDLQLGEGVFVTFFIVLLVLVGFIMNMTLKPPKM
jgi:hypothetical protein